MNVLEKAHLAKELQGLIQSLDQRSLTFYEIAKSKSRLKEIFLRCDEPIFKKQILNFKCHMQPELAAREFAQHSLYAQSFRGVFLNDHALEQALEQHPEMGWAILYQANVGFQIWYIPAPHRAALMSDWDGLEENYAWMLEQQEIYHGLKTDTELSLLPTETSKGFKFNKKISMPSGHSSTASKEGASSAVHESSPNTKAFYVEPLALQHNHFDLTSQTAALDSTSISSTDLALKPKNRAEQPIITTKTSNTTASFAKTSTAAIATDHILPQVIELGEWKCRLTALQFPQAKEYALCSLILENVSDLMPLLEVIVSASQLTQYSNQAVYLAEQINAQGRFVKFVVILGAEDQLHAIRLGNIVSQHYAYEITALKLLPNEQKLKQCKTAEQFFELYREQAQLVWKTDTYQPYIPAKCVQKHKLIAFEEATASFNTPLILLRERQKIRVIHGHARLQLSEQENAYPYILLDRNQGVSWQLVQGIIQTLAQPISAKKLYEAIQKHIDN